MKSLLWPMGPPQAGPESGWTDDLDLPLLVRALDYDGRQSRLVQQVLTALETDPATIRSRQAVLEDLRSNPELAGALEAQLPALTQLAEAGRVRPGPEELPLLAVARRLHELSLYTQTVQAIRDALDASALRSEGLKDLRDELRRIAADPIFVRLVDELPDLERPLERLASVTVGINLDNELRPVAATLVAINEYQFKGSKSLLGRLFGSDEADGLTPLRSIDPHARDPFAAQLFRDLGRLVAGVAEELAKGIARYSRIAAGPLAAIRGELAFYLGSNRLIERLEAAGLPLVMPEILPIEERRTEVEGLYDVTLALRLLDRHERPELVLNDLSLGESGRLAILTGPNRGGKTTYSRAAGLVHVLAQAGLPVPARTARLAPVDMIFTQFPRAESRTLGLGRFDEEAQRLSTIFDRATPSSLILLNEPLSGTNPEEALKLARGIVSGLQQLGARTILVTHLHALGREAPDFSAAAPRSPVVSLVASAPTAAATGDNVERSFRVEPRPPVDESRAMEIARAHGLAPEQIQARLRKRDTSLL